MNLENDLKKNSMFIDGKWMEGTSGKYFSVPNPATGDEVGSYTVGDRQTAGKAIGAADKAFRSWKEKTARERANYLLSIAKILMDNKESLAKILTMENGKPIKESLGEVGGAAAHFEWFAEEATRMYGRIVPPTNSSKRHIVIKQPIGVAACVAPWNFPLVLWARKVAPALAAGCTVVSRAASQTTLVTIAAMKLIEEAKLPAGVLNLVTGPAADVMNEFIENDKCRKISFTGSTEVGREIMRKGAEQIKHLSLELGGLAPAIVFDDADIDGAVKGVLGAKFRNGGQSCIAINRIYIQKNIAGAFNGKLVEAVKNIKVGNGLRQETDLGPLVDKKAVEKFLRHVDDATDKGGTLLSGGKRMTVGEFGKGNFVEPTVISGAKDDMLCMCDETFGPLAPIATFTTFDEVIERANATPFGLSAYVYTRNLSLAFKAGEMLEAGTVGVNDDVPSTTIAPFGGMKQSGLGRECGTEGLDAFLETKHISMVL
ncbi:MAG TPA: NAD-dependent succinate-semialdehyde dehydrogenase [Bacteroidota bacterium]|nr:NAD-dependent succinate-semialdehyde dehydrogenase [Bacteroidota bacterium]